MDQPDADKKFKEILIRIRLMKNGETVSQMKQRGVSYKINWGVSVIALRDMAKRYAPDHILALKLWNKGWRETMILATLIDQPELVTEEQMDYWTKSIENTELAEQAVVNLWVKTKFAYVKALEWCRGKKHLVRYTGLHLMGRLAMTDKKAIDEMFEPFFDVLFPLAKDERLQQVFYRSYLFVGMHSSGLNKQAVEFALGLKKSDSEQAGRLGELLAEELQSEYVQESIQGR